MRHFSKSQEKKATNVVQTKVLRWNEEGGTSYFSLVVDSGSWLSTKLTPNHKIKVTLTGMFKVTLCVIRHHKFISADLNFSCFLKSDPWTQNSTVFYDDFHKKVSKINGHDINPYEFYVDNIWSFHNHSWFLILWHYLIEAYLRHGPSRTKVSYCNARTWMRWWSSCSKKVLRDKRVMLREC